MPLGTCRRAGGGPYGALDSGLRFGGTPGAGAGESDRVTLIWADGAIRNGWLEVTVKATAQTGLVDPDMFYFGHLAGDTDGDGRVDLGDLAQLASRWNGTGGLDEGDVTGDGAVDLADLAVLASQWNTALPRPGATTTSSAPVELAPAAAVQPRRPAVRAPQPRRAAPARTAPPAAKRASVPAPERRSATRERAGLLDEPVVDLLAAPVA